MTGDQALELVDYTVWQGELAAGRPLEAAVEAARRAALDRIALLASRGFSCFRRLCGVNATPEAELRRKPLRDWCRDGPKRAGAWPTS